MWRTKIPFIDSDIFDDWSENKKSIKPNPKGLKREDQFNKGYKPPFKKMMVSKSRTEPHYLMFKPYSNANNRN